MLCRGFLAFAVLCLPMSAARAISIPFFGKDVVTVESDHAAALARRTYCWGDVHLLVAQYDSTVKAAVDKALAAKGWQLVAAGGSTTLFATGDVQGEAQLAEDYSKQGGGWGAGQWGWQGLGAGWKPQFGEATVNALATAESHLVLDIFDTSRHTLLFRGVMVEDVSGTEKANTKGLQKRLASILKKLSSK